MAAERPSPRPFTRNEVCTEPGVVQTMGAATGLANRLRPGTWAQPSNGWRDTTARGSGERTERRPRSHRSCAAQSALLPS